jgi:FkbM family methyltransferase
MLAAPGIRHGLRWFINEPSIPATWRRLAHRKLAKRAQFGDREFTYTTPAGVDLRLLHTGTSNYLYWLDEYEPETTSLFVRLAMHARVILDIGAADGIYAILAAAANPTARIIAFEPGESAARTCTRNFDLNRAITKHVELVAVALGDCDEVSTLYVAGESGGTSSMNPVFRADRQEQAVRVHKGDNLLAELGVPFVDLIKIDTESTEPLVLRGLHETLSQHRPDVICEVLAGRTEHDLEALLTPLGYRFYWITEGGLVRHDHLVGDNTYRQPNYLFTMRPEQALVARGAVLANR